MEQVLLYSNILLWLVQIITFFAMFLIFRQFGEVYLSKGESISRDGIVIGYKAPVFQGRTYDNKQLLFENLIKQNPTLVVFISPRCKACQYLIPDWNQAYAQYHSSVSFVLIGLGSQQEFEEWFKNKSLTGELILDSSHELFSNYKVRVTPFGFMIDQDGIVKGKGLCNNKAHIEGLLSSLKEESFEFVDENTTSMERMK